MKRWLVTIFYHTDNGAIDVEHDIEELAEIQALVERGPSFLTIEKIAVTYTRRTPEILTIEASILQ